MKARIDQVRRFFREVWEEIMKGTPPSSAELEESTLVVVATMAMIGLFIFVSDFLLSRVLGFLITFRS